MKDNPIFRNFQKAVSRLEESVTQEKTIERRDSALMRFQLSFDSCIKSIKEYMRTQGKETYTAKQVLKAAFEVGLIEHNPEWLQMVNDRNEIIHSYNEEIAEAIYSKLPEYLELFKSLIPKLEQLED